MKTSTIIWLALAIGAGVIIYKKYGAGTGASGTDTGGGGGIFGTIQNATLNTFNG